MQIMSFNHDWMFHHDGKNDHVPVTLPHDAMLHDGRDAASPGKDAYGYFIGGVYVYEKSFHAPADAHEKHMELAFGGVYRNTTVYVNGKKAGERPYGYVPFNVDLDGLLIPDANNEIRVVADNSRLPNSRWYSGGGIYRSVQLLCGAKEYITWHGLKVTTVSIKPATIQIDVDAVCRPGTEFHVQVFDGNRVVAEAEENHAQLKLPDAVLWSAETPKLYRCTVELLRDGKLLDSDSVCFGIRSLRWSAKEGFLVNGKVTKLRGGCIHHDNGILGACSYQKAEDRKVRILKEAGFNAVRISHNPASDELLNACDRYGMYVMDEAFDMWFMGKNTYDYAVDFPLWHERDISHSSVERVIFPDATIALDYILHETTNLIDKLLVYPEKMLADLNLTGGLIYSPRVLLALVAKGAYRDTAYRWVQRNAMKRWLQGEDFYENLCKDEDVRQYLTPEEIKACFDYKPMLVHVDEIFARFGL